MSTKRYIYLFMTIGSVVGGWLPTLWGADAPRLPLRSTAPIVEDEVRAPVFRGALTFLSVADPVRETAST